MNPGLKALLEADEERYPRSLEAKFKRISDRIVDLWGTPGLEDYFTSLLIDDREARYASGVTPRRLRARPGGRFFWRRCAIVSTRAACFSPGGSPTATT